jgi:hypothetical protein
MCSCFVLFARKEKKKKKGDKQSEAVPKVDMPLVAVLPKPALPKPLGAIISCFKGQHLNFMCTLCVGSNLVG